MQSSNNGKSGKYALVTGASEGIGFEIARELARQNYNIILVALPDEKLQQAADDLAGEFNIETITIGKNLFEMNAAQEVYDEVKRRNLEVEILVNDAGQGEWGKFAETDLEREIDIIHLNIVSLVTLTKHFLREMLQRGSGRILQVSSLVGKLPSPLMAVYAGTKAFVYNFTESVINELKDTGVTMTALLPGATDTDFFEKAGAEHTTIYQKGGLDDPAKVAKEAVEALFDGDSRVITGVRNKVQAIMGNVTPDTALAEVMRKQMEPANGDDKK